MVAFWRGWLQIYIWGVLLIKPIIEFSVLVAFWQGCPQCYIWRVLSAKSTVFCFAFLAQVFKEGKAERGYGMKCLFGHDVPQLLSIITNLPGEAFGLWFSPVLSCIYIAIKGAESDFCSKPAALSSNDLSHFGNGMAACANRVSCQKRRPILLISSPAGAYAPQIFNKSLSDNRYIALSVQFYVPLRQFAAGEFWTLIFEFWIIKERLFTVAK